MSTAERTAVAAASLNCVLEGWLQDVADTVTIRASSSFERLFLDAGKWVVYMNVALTDQSVLTCSGAFTTVK